MDESTYQKTIHETYHDNGDNRDGGLTRRHRDDKVEELSEQVDEQ